MTGGRHPSGESGPEASAGFRILVVCTGNICRSPALASLLRQALAQTPVQVSSAGTRAVVGSGMHPLTVAALAERGLNDSCHVARQLAPALVRSADLVLTAERTHRVSVAHADPSAVRRTFTVAEFARLAPTAVEELDRDDPEGWRRLVARAASLRGTGVPANAMDDDLPDPISGGPDDHRRIVARALPLVDAISGPVRTRQ